MSVIPVIIPPQSFEVVRDRLGAILADELGFQSVLAGNDPEINATVWAERVVPFGITEMPACNVMLARGELGGHTAIQTDGTYMYYVDVYSRAKTSAAQQGDSTAILRVHRLLGMVRAILENSRYKTLGFNPPFVMNRHCREMFVADPGQQDAMSTCMGRIVVVVKVPETTELIQPVLIAGYDTQVKLEETDKGYFYAKAA